MELDRKTKLSDEQRSVVESTQAKVAVRAPAGSGKTTTLLEALIEYRHTYPRDRIDAITFTRAATAELVNRLQEAGVYDVNVSTIHVWARNYLQQFADLYQFQLRIIHEADIRNILNKIISAYHKKVDVEPVYNFIMNNVRINIPDRIKVTYEAIERRYIAYKRANALYDFTDYPLYLYDVLKERKDYIYDTEALFVDELQDIDEEQSRIFERVLARKKFYIGDEKQMIYGFRGASSEIFDKINDGEFKVFTLKNNYRSYQEIIDYANTVYSESLVRDIYISDVQGCNPSDIKCVRGNHGHVYVVNPFGECVLNGQKYVPLATAAEEIMNKHPHILCRTNREVDIIKNAGYANVSTIHKAKGLEYDNVVVIDFPVSKEKDARNVAYVALTRARDNLMVMPIALAVKFLPHTSNNLL